DRLPRLRRVEPPHVLGGHGAGRRRRLLDLDHADRGADRREDPELDRHALGRQDLLRHAALLLARLHRHVHAGRPLGRHARLAAAAPADPWDGRTLEWTTPSPPPVYNFAVVPVVHDRDDFWVQKYGDGHGTPPRKRVPTPTVDPASIHMPPPSYWPILLAGAF